MKTKMNYRYTNVLALAMITSIVCSGCATSMSHRSKNNEERVTVKRSETHTFTNIHIRHTDDGDVLYGTVKHNHRNSESNAHLDLAVVDSSGEVKYQASVPISASRVRGRYRDSKFRVPMSGRYRGAKFEIRLSETLETGSAVNIAFHAKRPKRRSTIECNDNQAVAMASEKTGEKP